MAILPQQYSKVRDNFTVEGEKITKHLLYNNMEKLEI